MIEPADENVTDEQIAEEIDEACEDGDGDEPQPWAKTSSGNADSITSD